MADDRQAQLNSDTPDAPARAAYAWLKARHKADGWILSVAAVLTAAALRQLMFHTPGLHTVGERSPFSFVYPAVTFAALVGGTGPGVLAAALGLIIEGLRLNGPPFPTFPAAEEWPRLILFILIDAMLIWICASMRRARGQAEAALADRARSERRSHAILESITDAFYSVDADWRYTYLNHQCEQYLGKTREELIGRVMWDVFPQYLGTEVEAAYRRAMRDQRKEHLELRSPVSGLWVEGHVYPSTDGLSVYFHNVTDRRATQEALRQSEERYRLLIDTAQEGIWMVDAKGATSYVNQAMAAMLDYPASEIVGRPMHDFMDETCRTRIEALEGDRLNAVAARQDFRFKRRDGRTFDAHVSENPILGPSTEYLGTLALVIDVTARRAVEAERAELLVREQRARAEAEAANRRKDHFLAVLSHELRTPLTPVLARVALMRREPSLTAAMRSGLDMIRRNVELEARLIDDLLDITRLARGQLNLRLETVDAHEQLRAAASIYETEMANREQTLTWELNATNPSVRADGVRLQQIFWNLVGNAVKYTPAGGRLTIRSENVDADPAATGVASAARLRVRIIDNGIGIPQDVMARLFDPFEQGEQTLTRRFGGLGLGLSISRTLAQAQGGSLTAESAGRGKGATFTVEMPTADVPATPDAAAPAPVVPVVPARRVLLVDDNEDTLRAMSRLLKLDGHQVITAGTMAAALTAAREPFDLLITDIGLPDGTGWELMQQIRQKRPNVTGIAVSGFTMEEDVRRSLDAGFAEHLSKPVSPQDLERAIARAVIAPTPVPI